MSESCQSLCSNLLFNHALCRLAIQKNQKNILSCAFRQIRSQNDRTFEIRWNQYSMILLQAASQELGTGCDGSNQNLPWGRSYVLPLETREDRKLHASCHYQVLLAWRSSIARKSKLCHTKKPAKVQHPCVEDQELEPRYCWTTSDIKEIAWESVRMQTVLKMPQPSRMVATPWCRCNRSEAASICKTDDNDHHHSSIINQPGSFNNFSRLPQMRQAADITIWFWK